MNREYDISNLELGSKLKLAREASGLSQAKLGKLLSLDSRTISSYEKGRIRIPAVTLCKFAKQLGCSIDQILGFKSEDGRTEEGRLRRKFLQLQELDQTKQDAVLHVIDAFLQNT